MADNKKSSRSNEQSKKQNDNGASKSKTKALTNGSTARNGGENRTRSKSRTGDKHHSSSRSESKTDKQKSKKSSQYESKSSKGGTRSSSSKKKNKKKKRPSAKEWDEYTRKAIPASIRMISGCHDSQTSADVRKISSQFQLPNPAGQSGGACTAALLQVLYSNHKSNRKDCSWIDVLCQMRDVLDSKHFEQIPQLTSSRIIDLHTPFAITPTDGSFKRKKNTQRALLIGINYTGQDGQLSGCHHDVNNVAKYLMEVESFKKENITILMDDGKNKNPTKSNILTAYKRLVRACKDGDVVFCHYSGHGGRVHDDNGDEEDGYDETLIPVDYAKAGQIRDDELLKTLIHPMPAGVNMTCLMDCCHSGTVLDLPYRFVADGESEEMEMNEKVNFEDALWQVAGLALGVAAGAAAVSALESAAEPAMMILGGGPNAIHEYSDSDCCVVS
jgi:hypothetical protein